MQNSSKNQKYLITIFENTIKLSIIANLSKVHLFIFSFWSVLINGYMCLFCKDYFHVHEIHIQKYDIYYLNVATNKQK